MNELLKEYAPVVGFLTFLLGFIIVNRLTLSRDRRKEFNNIVQPIRSWLLSEREDPSPYKEEPSKIEMDDFVHYLPIWKRRKFKGYLAELEKQIAKLPTEAAPIDVSEKDEELAQRFDHMLLSMQLSLVDKTGISDAYQDKLNAIASKLESKIKCVITFS